MKSINSEFFNSNQLRDLGIKSVGKDVLIHKTCIIVGLENISIGNNVRIDGFTSIIAPENGFLSLGSHIHIASHCYLGASAGIIMDDFSGIAYGVKVHSVSDDYSGNSLTNSTISLQYKNVHSGTIHVGKHSIIGANSVILPGVIIPIGCSVGALSLVNKNLEEWSIYFGSPVKKIRSRSKELLDLEKKYLNGGSND